MSSKKILIIAHFFEPCNVIAAHRPKSWAKTLVQAGHEVEVITRHWDGTEKNWDEYLGENLSPVKEVMHPDGYKIIYHPFKKSFFQRLNDHKLIKPSKLFRFAVELKAHLLGRIDYDRDAYSNYYPFLNQLFSRQKFDVVISTSGPYISLKLASFLKKKHNFIWFADFRDVWNNELLKSNPKDQLRRNRIRFFFHQFHIKSWLKRVDFILSCSEGFDPVFKSIAPNKEVIMVKNGFESKLYENYEAQALSKFTILCLGTLYQEQDKKHFFEAVKNLIKERGTDDIEIKFIGAKINPAVAQEITDNIDSKVLVLTDFVDRKIALQETINAHLLFYPVWTGYKGIYSGKIFEYLGSKRNILVLPKDHSVLDNLLEQTNAGRSFDSVPQCSDHLVQLFDEWKKNGKVLYHGKLEEIEQYTRESQSQIVANKINKL